MTKFNTIGELVKNFGKTTISNISTSFDINDFKTLVQKDKIEDENFCLVQSISSLRKQVKKEFGLSIENTAYSNYHEEQDFKIIRETHSISNRFVDKLFETNDSSIFSGDSLKHRLLDSGKIKEDKPVKWKRAKDLLDNAKFFDISQPNDKPGRASLHLNELNSGQLNNSLLLSAISEINRNFHLLKRLIPFDNSFDDDLYTGAFHFHFWNYGTWIDIVVDDYLPIDTNYHLLFSHCTKPENIIWFSLLEKAYAKLCGCYEVLENLRITEILLDLTGGSVESYNLEKIKNSHNLLWNVLFDAYIKNSSIACITEISVRHKSSNEVSNNLRITHLATKMCEIKRKSNKIKKLICIKDLTGKLNETLKNFDKSRYFEDMSEEYLKELKYDDNDFWILFEDFLDFFKKIDVFNFILGNFNANELNRTETILKLLNCESFHGNWIKNISAGGHDTLKEDHNNYWLNPQYTFLINENDLQSSNSLLPISISLVQKHSKSKIRKNECINISLYKITDLDAYKRSIKHNESINSNDLEHIKANKFDKLKYSYKSVKEISARFELPIGAYVIIPSTYNQNVEIEFYLRIFCHKLLDKKNFIQFNF